jgi:UDP-N-acetylglucosamine--N-acetylmuramyl-(pentapeptide) pyrophosphoryl-undecaprenol N-acetylglucosamine transferase
LSTPLFVMAGGGTGGHLFPGIAVAASLKELQPDARFLFAGSGRTVEQSILGEAGFETLMLNVPPVASARRHPLRFLRGHFADWSTARRLIDEHKPAAVIGLGGLTSLAVANAAIHRGVKVVLLEQNVIPGRATRRLSRRAVVCSSFEDTTNHLPGARQVVFTGNPLRPEISRAEKTTPNEIAGRNSLLILGGSQGSQQVNEAVLNAARQVAAGPAAETFRQWSVIHQTGPTDTESVRAEWQRLGIPAVVEPFFNDLPRRYVQASLVISRSGATTLAELACLNLPSILIPYEHARDDHQTANAAVFQKAGAARLIDPRASDFENQLAESLTELVASAEQRERMSENCEALARRNAADTVASIVLS